MSLLLDAMENCIMLNKITENDGYGGYITTYTEGAEFNAAITLNTSISARVAEKQESIGRYDVLYPKYLNLEYHDVFRRVKDGKIFRVTENGGEVKAPNTASAEIKGLAKVSVEQYTLPTGGA